MLTNFILWQSYAELGWVSLLNSLFVQALCNVPLFIKNECYACTFVLSKLCGVPFKATATWQVKICTVVRLQNVITKAYAQSYSAFVRNHLVNSQHNREQFQQTTAGGYVHSFGGYVGPLISDCITRIRPSGSAISLRHKYAHILKKWPVGYIHLLIKYVKLRYTVDLFRIHITQVKSWLSNNSLLSQLHTAHSSRDRTELKITRTITVVT